MPASPVSIRSLCQSRASRQSDCGPGDEVVIEAEGEDRIVVHRAAPDLAHALGVFDGRYEPGYLEKLRSEERA